MSAARIQSLEMNRSFPLTWVHAVYTDDRDKNETTYGVVIKSKRPFGGRTIDVPVNEENYRMAKAYTEGESTEVESDTSNKSLVLAGVDDDELYDKAFGVEE